MAPKAPGVPSDAHEGLEFPPPDEAACAKEDGPLCANAPKPPLVGCATGVPLAPKLDFPKALGCPKPDWPKAGWPKPDWPKPPDGFASNPLFPNTEEGLGVSAAEVF